MGEFVGHNERAACPEMPSIRYSARAITDLVRLYEFLAAQDPDAAKRAITAIRTSLDQIAYMPARFRPVEGKTNQREALISFGKSGYIARFRHLPNGDITIARIRHQKEFGFN